jgi:hypothetical protein
MHPSKCLIFAVMAVMFVSTVFGQDEAELRIKRILEGRQMIAKMDLPAVSTGIPMIFDDTKVSFDESNYKHLINEYGVAIAKGTRARITGVRFSKQGFELDLDGGGSPSRDWFVSNVKVQAPDLIGKSDREINLERRIQMEADPATLAFLKNELEYEQRARYLQDQRNQEAYQRMSQMRSSYIEENRKSWGSKLIFVVHPGKKNLMMRDMFRSLAKYVELLPRETTGQ